MRLNRNKLNGLIVKTGLVLFFTLCVSAPFIIVGNVASQLGVTGNDLGTMIIVGVPALALVICTPVYIMQYLFDRDTELISMVVVISMACVMLFGYIVVFISPIMLAVRVLESKWFKMNVGCY